MQRGGYDGIRSQDNDHNAGASFKLTIEVLTCIQMSPPLLLLLHGQPGRKEAWQSLLDLCWCCWQYLLLTSVTIKEITFTAHFNKKYVCCLSRNYGGAWVFEYVTKCNQSLDVCCVGYVLWDFTLLRSLEALIFSDKITFPLLYFTFTLFFLIKLYVNISYM